MIVENNEMEVFVNVFPFVMKELEGEVSIRTGFDESELDDLIHNLRNKKALTCKDFMMLDACLNEMCYGLDLSEHISDMERTTLLELHERIKG